MANGQWAPLTMAATFSSNYSLLGFLKVWCVTKSQIFEGFHSKILFSVQSSYSRILNFKDFVVHK